MLCEHCMQPIAEGSPVRYAQRGVRTRAQDGDEIVYDMAQSFHAGCLDRFLRAHPDYSEGTDH